MCLFAVIMSHHVFICSHHVCHDSFAAILCCITHFAFNVHDKPHLHLACPLVAWRRDLPHVLPELLHATRSRDQIPGEALGPFWICFAWIGKSQLDQNVRMRISQRAWHASLTPHMPHQVSAHDMPHLHLTCPIKSARMTCLTHMPHLHLTCPIKSSQSAKSWSCDQTDREKWKKMLSRETSPNDLWTCDVWHGACTCHRLLLQ